MEEVDQVMSSRRTLRSRFLAKILTAAVPATIMFSLSGPVNAGTAYVRPDQTFGTPTPGNPSKVSWNGIVLDSKQGGSSVPTASSTCPAPVNGKGICEDLTLAVPGGLTQSTLYVKISWHHPVWKAYLYLTSPGGTLYGGTPSGVPTPPETTATHCDDTSYQKGCGNETNLPFDEVTIANPTAGNWKLRVSAVTIHDEAYTGFASLTNSAPLQFLKENLATLATHLTRSQRINVVTVGWAPTAQELAEMKASLPDQYVPSVAGKQDPGNDCGDLRDNTSSGLVQHQTCHFTGTDSTNPNVTGVAGNNPNVPQYEIPYLEPIKYNFDYHFFKSDSLYAQDLFAVAKAVTRNDQPFGPTSVHAYLQPMPVDSKAAYLRAYNAQFGVYRGAANQVSAADAGTPDMVDAFAVEDWIQNTRLSSKYCNSFTDLDTGKTTGAQFINPDPNAQRDPYWDGNGTRAVNPDRNPQGLNQGITFLLLDTFSPDYAKNYFRPNHFHTWASFEHITDPDLNQPEGILDGRGWGGRYRFYFQDLGAAPSPYERAQWARFVTDLSATATEGSAGFDPPIWQYRNDPQWNGTGGIALPTAVGGNTLGKVMGWDINQGLAFKYIGSYLYRPYPSDVYVVAANTWIDHYSQPSQGDFYAVIAGKLYKPDVALKALNSAAPYATFDPGTSQQAILGCATNHYSLKWGPNLLSPPTGTTPGIDATCGVAGNNPDPRQEALESAKSNGSGAVVTVAGQQVPDFAINPAPIQDFIDHNRSLYAPLYDGAFTIPVVNLMLEKVYSMALPALASGIAAPANSGDGWGTINTRNDARVLKAAIDCANSAAAAPGCGNNPDIFPHDGGLTYVAEHEAAHFLGLHHPHDGTTSVEKGSGPSAAYPNSGSPLDGAWHYYYWMLKWQHDYTASPTTYGHSYGIYEVVDQERLMIGHAAEYMNQAQDWIADAYFTDGANGLTSPSATTTARLNAMTTDRNSATQLFKVGDYLHAQYAMKDAALHAKGITQAAVQPHLLTRAEAAADLNAVFVVNPQAAFDPNRSTCSGGGGGGAGGGGCHEVHGSGDIKGKNGGTAHFQSNESCPPGGQDGESAQDAGAHEDFHSTSVQSTQFDAGAGTMTIVGIGVSNGLPVTFLIVEQAATAASPALYTIQLSDGYINTGPLLSGAITLR
jgi:hypothetical protein